MSSRSSFVLIVIAYIKMEGNQVAKIYFSKFNMSELSKEIQEDDTFLNKTLKNLFNSLSDSKKHVILESENDDNIYYRLHSVETNYKLNTISGRLLKVAREKEIETIDGDEVESYDMKNVFSSIAFSFGIYEEIVAFVPKRDFRKEEFHKYFGKMLNRIYPNIKTVNFKLLVDEGSLKNKLAQIDKTTLAVFTLVKPNGIADDTVDDIKNILTDTDTSEAELALKGEKERPIKKDSSSFKGLLEYITNGWGFVKIKGYKEGQRKSIDIDTSKELLKKEPISESNKDSHKYIENKIFGGDE